MADTQKVDHPVFYRVVGTVPYSDYSGLSTFAKSEDDVAESAKTS